MFIKVTALGYQSSVSTTYFDAPKVTLINSFKIWTIMLGKKGTELRDESGKNILFVQESPEEIQELLNKD